MSQESFFTIHIPKTKKPVYVIKVYSGILVKILSNPNLVVLVVTTRYSRLSRGNKT